MQEVTTTSVPLPSSEAKDVLTEILREGAQTLLVQAIEAEVADWIDRHAPLTDEMGHRLVVRNGRLPKREITTGVGQVEIEQPRVHDRRGEGAREHANQAFDLFLETYQAKYSKACECLKKDRDVLLTFYDFPAEHWIHLRTTNPIESTFATVRHRQRKTKGNGTRLAFLTMVFKRMESAAKKWRLLNGSQIIPDIIQGFKFIDGIREDKVAA